MSLHGPTWPPQSGTHSLLNGQASLGHLCTSPGHVDARLSSQLAARSLQLEQCALHRLHRKASGDAGQRGGSKQHYAMYPHAYLTKEKLPQLSLRIKAPSIDYAVRRLSLNLVQRFHCICPPDNVYLVRSLYMPGCLATGDVTPLLLSSAAHASALPQGLAAT